MSDEPSKNLCFVDSNIWLYILLPGQDAHKGKTARELVEHERPNIIVSTQVVNEVINTIIRHASMDELEIRELVRRFYARYQVRPITEAIQLNASHLRENYSLSHWDSLIVATALHVGASQLYSEDMQDGLVIDKQLTIVNPLLAR
jgi:predicted nucleic acid-binding protein